MVYNFFNKKTGSGISVIEQLAEELYKPVTKNFKRRKIYARFKDNIWAAGLAEMESLSSKNENVKYLLKMLKIVCHRCTHGLNLRKIKKVKQF